jgi:hypothetical protein
MPADRERGRHARLTEPLVVVVFAHEIVLPDEAPRTYRAGT